MTAPAAAFRRTTRFSRLIFHWTGARRELNALSGQAGTLVRAATASPVDVNGVTYTAEQSQPAWEAVDLDGDGVRETNGLLLGANDAFTFDHLDLPRLITVYTKFVERGSCAANKGVLALGIAAGTSPYFRIEASGAKYRSSHHNGVGPAVVSTAAAAPSSGNTVEARAVLRASGATLFGQAINGAAEAVAAASAGLTLAAAWSDTKLLVNRVDAATVGTTWMAIMKIAGGEITLADMRTRF